MLHERRVSNYGIQMKYQNILFLIYIISYWHHSKARGHTFCLREKGISACGCQHSPWGQGWDLSNWLPLCCHQPGDMAEFRCWHTLTHFSLLWMFLQCISSSCCPWMSSGTAGSDSATSSPSPFLGGENLICLKWIGGTVPHCHVS